MSFRDGVSRDIEASRARAKALADQTKVLRIGDILALVKTGQISDRRALEVVADIVSGDAERVVRVGYRPDIQTGETT